MECVDGPSGADSVTIEVLRAMVVGSTLSDAAGLKVLQQARRRTDARLWRFVVQNARVPRNANGTMCHVAAGLGLWQMYRFLADSGGNPFALDGCGRLPSEIARCCGYVCAAVHIKCLYETIQPA